MKVIEGWKELKIRDTFVSSIPGDWGEEGNSEDGIPVLRSTNFRNNGSIDYSDITYRKIDESRLYRRLIGKGSILIEKSGGSPSQPAGRVVYCDNDFNGTASNFIEIVKVKDEFSPAYVAYLLYYLYQIGLIFKYQQQTTGIINFKLNEYCEEMVLCPLSKTEQAKIAEILSTIDKAIEKTEALIAKHQRIKTGLMQDLLTRGIDEHGNIRSEQTHQFKDSPLGRIPVEWEVMGVTDLCSDIFLGLTTKVDYIESGGVPLVRAKDINKGKLSFEETLEISLRQHQKLIKYRRARKGDILISKSGTLGICAIVDSDKEFSIYESIIAMQPSISVCDSQFLLWLMRFDSTQSRLLGETVGSTVGHLNLLNFRKLIVPLPVIDEQKMISEVLNRFTANLESVLQKKDKLKSLKIALMQDLLTGKKRVTPLLNDTEVVN